MLYGTLKKDIGYPPEGDEDDFEEDFDYTKRKFIMVTAEFAGFGFAKQAIDYGHEVIVAFKPKEEEDLEDEACLRQGEGIFDMVFLDDLMKKREEYRDWYWIWDLNHNYEEGEKLREEGFKVFGGSKFTYDLENDREFGTEFSEGCGLEAPETHNFTSAEEGISFLEEHCDESYVFKPCDEGDNSLTYCPISEEPANANKEVVQFIKAFQNESATKNYILQKMVKGVEVNCEAFFVNGVPYFAHANFEDKFTNEYDTGMACGCALDVEFEIPLSCRLYQETVGKFEEKLREMNFTGIMDANVIVGEDKVYFLEFCGRLGYNASPNLFINLIKDKCCFDVLADMIDGITDIECRPGFGASITVFTEKFKMGLPIYYPESMEKNVYLFDAFKEDDSYCICGTDHETLIVLDHGYTIKQALENAVKLADKVVFKNCYFRRDADKRSYRLNPQDRYDALQAMKMI